MTITLADARAYVKTIPFFLEHFLDNEETRETYVRSISPLFIENVMNDIPIAFNIEVATYAAPLYHIVSNPGLTRDPGVINTPSILQTEFWHSYFRDAMGSELNVLVSDSFNKLKFPYLNEVSILFDAVARRLTADEDHLVFQEINSDLSLKIINAKLDAIYSFLNYKPVQSSFIESWLDSMYSSGVFSTRARRDQEENLFNIQDVKAELTRRKFAGSAAIYDIILSGINSRGTFAPTVPLKSVHQEGSFKDPRAIRALDLPGITTVTSNVNIDPLRAFSDVIPLKVLATLYYTSGAKGAFDSKDFNEVPHEYLRFRVSSFAWDNIKGILDPTLIRDVAPRLDQTNPHTAQTYQLDTEAELAGGEVAPFRLDDMRPMFDLTSADSGLLSLQADKVLYHENTLQRSRGHEYPYLTYTIANNHGLSMMDVPWMDYIENVLENKKKIQERVGIGTQVSKFISIAPSEIEEGFIVITFSENLTASFTAQSNTYTSSMRYAYLWYVKLTYDLFSFNVMQATPSLLTYILLRVDEDTLSPAKREEYKNHPSYNEMTSRSVGLIPFTYPHLTTGSLLNHTLQLDNNYIRDDFRVEDYTKATFLFTPYENIAIAKRYLRTSPGALVESGEWFNEPSEDAALKHVIFGISRQNEVDPNIRDHFWSDPIRVYPKEIMNIKQFHPDWQDTVMYINPYLNFVSECASPLRHRLTAPRALRPATSENPTPEEALPDQIGPGLDVALTNLNIVHNMHVYKNDTGGTDPYIDADTPGDNYPYGTYFHKHRPAELIEAEEQLQIRGDNRPGDGEYANDPLDDWDAGLVRTTIHEDNVGVKIIEFRQGLGYTPGAPVDSYYTIAPDNTDTRKPEWKDWQWNNTKNSGLTACIDLHIQDIGEDQWLISRSHPENGDNVHAEFDFFFNTTHELVFRVYPTGRVQDFFFEEILAADHILDKQSQIACAYHYYISPSDYEQLNINISIVADRTYTTSYYATVKNGDAYDIYETDNEFDVTELTPPNTVSLPVTHDYLEGYHEETNPYRFGKLIKYQEQANNDLADIRFFNKDGGHELGYGYNPVVNGHLYDLRLYNRGAQLEEAIIMHAGTRRELYSYSPSLYKLAYQHFIDLGILKRSRNLASDPLSSDNLIGRIRTFDRSVWDSIIVDLYPASEEEIDTTSRRYDPNHKNPIDDTDIYTYNEELETYEYAANVIDQPLVSQYEYINEVTIASGTDVFYRGSPVTVGDEAFSLLQTCLYPMRYTNVRFDSGLILRRDEAVTGIGDGISYKAFLISPGEYGPESDARPAIIPSNPAGDTLQYKLSVEPGFEIANDVNAAAPYARGDNITISFNENLDDFVVKHRSEDKSKGLQQNHMLYPLYFPRQADQAEFQINWRAYLTGFNVEGVKLSYNLSRMLDATTYYTEIQTPYAYEDSTSSVGLSYTSRWNAIRLLKDGEYYITCKYPVQILPFENSALKNKVGNIPVFYLAFRFKIVVNSKPRAYSEDKLEGYNPIWDPELIDTVIADYYKPDDNRTFPHREVNIDLFTMENNDHSPGGETWRWRKIASNHHEDSSVQLITAETLEGNIPLQKTLYGYLTKNYLAPFFIYDEGGNPPIKTDPVSIIIAPTRYGLEKLTALNETDLDNITLITSRTYNLLMDYSSKVCEFSYTHNKFTSGDVLTENISAEELENYQYLTNILDAFDDSYPRSNINTDFMYTNKFNWSGSIVNSDLDAATGYAIDEHGNWIEYNTNHIENNMALGDPYALSNTKNGLLTEGDHLRTRINNICYFTYRQEDTTLNHTITPRLFGAQHPATREREELSLIEEQDSGALELMRYPVMEYQIIMDVYDKIRNLFEGSIASFIASASGAFTALSKLHLQFQASGANTITETITPQTHTLRAYKLKPFTTPIAHSIRLERQGLYTSNIVPSQYYLNKSNFSSPNGSEYIYDEEKERDVWALNTEGATAVNFNYNRRLPSNTTYEIALSIKAEKATDVTLKTVTGGKRIGSFQFSSPTVDVVGTETVPADEWTVVSWEATGRFSRLEFEIENHDETPLNGSEILISKLFVRKKRSFRHEIAFSDFLIPGSAVQGQDQPIITARNKLIVYHRENSNTFFPLQFNPRLSSNDVVILDRAQRFFDEYNLHDSVKDTTVIRMVNPFIRTFSYKQSNPNKVNVLKNKANREEMKEEREVISAAQDLYKVFNHEEDPNEWTFRYYAPSSSVEIGGEPSTNKGLVLYPDRLKDICNANLTFIPATLYITEERFSLVSNCVNPERFERGERSVVAMTNIQVINSDSEDPAVLYELEYLPIIYDESKHHLGVNLLVRVD